MSSAPRDENREAGLIAKSDADNTPVVIEADAATKRLKVSAIITGGGSSGTQYTDGDVTVTHPVGTIPVFDNSGTISKVSASSGLPVNIVAGSSSGVQYTQGGATVANPTGTAEIWFDGSGNPKAVTPSQPLPSNVTDGTNIAAVKAASTAAGATDKALVVAVSPNNTIPVSLATNTPTLQSGTNAVGTVNLSPTASGGWTPYFANAITTTVAPTAAAGKFGGYMLINLNSAPAYLQVFDTTGAVTLGSTTPTFVIPIPANSTAANGLAANVELSNGLVIANGIKCAATTTATGASTVSTGLTGTLWVK